MINESFVPVAIDINLVINQQDSEGKFFRHIAEQGHYAGRVKPTPTRQGLYATGVDGDLLHSVNSTSAARIIGMMSRSLAKWETKQGSDRNPMFEEQQADRNFSLEFPEGGLILRQTMRDLPNPNVYKQPTERHNFDHVWLTAAEKEEFVPPKSEVGHEWSITEKTVRRLAAFHTVDQVRGEANAWRRHEVIAASIDARVSKVTDEHTFIRLEGASKCRKPASGYVNPYNGKKIDKDMTNDLTIQGIVKFNRKSREFESFRMIAAGSRSGADVYNFRWNDMGPSSIGFAFELLPDEPENRIRPKFLFSNYFSP